MDRARARARAAGTFVQGEEPLNLRGAGDRWLAGEPVAGVQFALHDAVTVADGPYVGESGSIVLLMGLRPEPTYLVEVGSGRGKVRIRQSELRTP